MRIESRRNKSSNSTQPACSIQRKGLAVGHAKHALRPPDAADKVVECDDRPSPARARANRDRRPESASEPKTWKCVSIRPPVTWISRQENSAWLQAITIRVQTWPGSTPSHQHGKADNAAPPKMANHRCW